MALQKQVVRMSAEGGLDTKTDEKSVLSTNYLELENIVFTKTGAFSKRFGYTAYTKSILNATTQIDSGQAATTFKQELLAYSDNNLYSYAASENKWVDKSTTKFALSDEVGIATNGDRLTQPCHATTYGLSCYVYNRTTLNTLSTGQVEYRIVDDTTGAVIFTDQIANAASPQVVAFQGRFLIFYYYSSTIRFRIINFSTPHTISSETTALSVGFNKFMVEAIGNRAYLVAPDTTGLLVAYVTGSGSVSTPISVTDAAAFDFVSVSAEQTSSVRLVCGGSTSVKTTLYSADLNVQTHSMVTLASSSCSFVGAVQDPADANKSQIYYSLNSAPYQIMRAVVQSDGTIDSNAVVFYQACLQSRPQVLNNKVYFAFVKDSSFLASGPPYTPFRTLYFGNEDGEILNKFSDDAAVYLTTGSPPRLTVDGDKLGFCAAEAAEVQAKLTSTDVLVPTVVKKLSADFSTTNNYFDSTLGDNLHIAGGILKMYDGTNVVEHSFLEIPQAPELVSDTTTGGVMPDGQYQYIAVYKWIDKWGQVHRSYPSVPLTYTVSGGPKKPTIRVFNTSLSKKSDIEIEVYRTEVNGTTFYNRGYNYLDKLLNSSSSESQTFTDTMDDATLISNEVLYTTGGVLENTAADSSKHVTTYKGRLFLLLSDGYTIQYSKKREQNGPVEFSELFKTILDARGGAGTCLAVLDDNLIIFKERAIFAMAGEGPNALGEQDDFREPQFITSDCGCVDANSVVETPEGLMFKSDKGIYILKHGLSVEYIGAAVEAYNDLTITSATLMPNTNEVRFTTDNDRALVYDYYHKRWTTFTNIDGIDAVIYQNTYTYLRSNGDLMSETEGAFSDNGSYIKMKIVSAWLQLAGIQGFQRFYKMLLLGSYKTKHLLKVKFAYDFNPTWAQESQIEAGELLDTAEYGDDATYGASTVYGGQFPKYQFRIFPKRQKCEAIKFSIEDFKTDENGEAFTLSNFAAEVGIKPTASKVKASRSFGAS